MPRTRLLIPLALVLGAFALPAAANASFQARIIDSTHLSITGTDDPEAIVIGSDALGRLTHDQTSPGFASALDFDTTAPGTQPVTGSPIIQVDAEGGDDRIRNSTTGARLRADGGDGDDQIYGSANHDVILGGTGDDYAEGRGASDAIYLGSGDDSYHWFAATDGHDLVEGGDGTDDASAWGTQGADEFNVSPAGDGFHVALAGADQLHLVAVEDVSIPLFAGNDAVVTEPIGDALRLDVDGGAGDDSLAGGDGDDDLAGGDGRDSVSGYGGDDRLSGEFVVGDVGNDDMTLIADPSAFAEGDEGYDITTFVTTDGADSLTLSPAQSSYVRIQGTVGSAPIFGAAYSEALVVQTGAGDDAVTVQPGTGTVAPVSVHGGTGDDVLRGSDGVEHLLGSAGQDVIDGGLAPDKLEGGGSADVIRARDRAADAIVCDAADTVLTDLAALDQIAGACQPIPAAPATGAVPLARVVPAGDGLRLGSQGTIKMPVACSAGARAGCQGTLTLLSASPLANHKTIQLRLGNAAVSLAPGTTGEVAVKVAGGEDLVRLMGSRQLTAQAQVLTATAEHTVTLPLEVLR